MFRAGNILHGFFDLGVNGKKNKYAIVLHNDGNACVLMSFATSQLRSSSENPVHGRNPQKGEPQSYVFKAGVVIGTEPINKSDFSFPKDTTVVPDYGILSTEICAFTASVANLLTVCELYEKEYLDLIYTLYKCKKTKKKYKEIFEKILEQHN